ncbi:hypothetical protein JQX13_17065 [Archangium violaceum]|uniref:hypothetical protein n=1 Tax=Archangium violaceum TaxID=83451 RepID=UPI00193B3818|nr:hypothetical protein [Archangium violaceum]QRK11626.1 hypothetical protein JQX13_17065 [Archangium violaceum]
MFSVPRSQLRILAESTVDAYVERVTARIRADFVSELGALPYEDLRIRVHAALIWLRAQGFQRKEYLHRLIVLELLFGPRFETRLPLAARLIAFPPHGVPRQPESERFWAIYRAADQLTRGDSAQAAPSPGERAWGEIWR